MPLAGDDGAARANAHLRWAKRYSDYGYEHKAAAHFGRALDYAERLRFGADHESIGPSRLIRLAGEKVLWPGKTIGDGLEVKESEIPGAGNGLFATTDFLSNDVVTIYEGEWISGKEANSRPATHSRSIYRGLVIDGLKVPEHGRGGGSFINDPRNAELYNAKLVSVHIPEFSHGRLLKDKGVYVLATRWIRPGDEIYVNYGKGGFKRAMRKSPVDSRPSASSSPSASSAQRSRRSKRTRGQ